MKVGNGAAVHQLTKEELFAITFLFKVEEQAKG
jgi:hypothetical protein